MTSGAVVPCDGAGAPARGAHTWQAAALIAVGGLVAYTDTSLWLAVGVLPLILACVANPLFGAVAYLLVTPLIVGLSRDSILPLLRPNELLLLVIGAAVAVHLALGSPESRARSTAFDSLDMAFLLLATTGSLVPLLARFGRDLPITLDDVLYAVVLWKYFLIFRLFKVAVQNERQLRLCLAAALLASSLVAIVAILQVLDLFGVAQFLWRHFDAPFTGVAEPITARGTSTMASSFGVAGTMTMTLVIALVWLIEVRGALRLPLLAGAGLCLLGCFAAGQISGLIGLAVALTVVGSVTGRLKQVVVPVLSATVIAVLIFAPVIEDRLSDFYRGEGIPPSWSSRLDNLQQFVIPELSSGWTWLTGVRPAARVPAPEPWRDWVYIESGYIWLLWTGGMAMLGSFVLFTHTAGVMLLQRVRMARDDVARVAAVAALAGLTMIATLMLFDPHLTMRGTADLFFPLVAMALALPRPDAAGIRPADEAATPIRRSPVASSMRQQGTPA